MFDLIIKNATVYDGSGAPAYVSDVAVKDGKIAAIGKELGSAAKTVDAEGLALAPGFIDSHSHANASIFHDPERLHVLRQGVTTEVSGQCGTSIAPLPAREKPDECKAVVGMAGQGICGFDTVKEELDAVQQLPLALNHTYYTGHTAIRYNAMGLENRHANEEDIAKMQALLEEAMQAGSLGFSTGLSYVPGIYSETKELAEIAKIASKYGGYYVSHSRSESAGLFKAVQECIDIAREADIPVQISHLKVVGKTFWPRCDEMLGMIDKANREGLKVTMDAYPYVAVSTTTTSAIPARFLDQGRYAFAKMLENPAIVEEIRKEIFEIDDPSWDNSALHVGLENFLIVGADNTPDAIGMTYAEYGAAHGMTPFEAMMKLLHDNNGLVRDVRFAMSEENLEKILAHPLCSVGSDGVYIKDQELAHPRAFGSFPRFLGRYVRERKIMSREEGIYRMTGMPAVRFGLTGKGFIRPGMDADLVLFDYDTVIDQADFKDCFKPNIGIHQVYVGGELALENNEATGVRNGRYLKRWNAR